MAYVFLIILILIFLVQRWSATRVLHGVDFNYAPSLLLAAPEEKFQLKTNLLNSSRSFVPYIRTEVFLPLFLTIHDQDTDTSLKFWAAGKKPGVVYNSDDENSYSYTTYLMPRSGLVHSLQVSICRRGRYVFSGARLWGGDFFGWNENRKKAETFGEVVVYPR